MISTGGLIAVALSLIFLVASGLWAGRRFSGFDQLPLHYGPTLKATRMGSRNTAIWLPTGIMMGAILLTLFLAMTIEADQAQSETSSGVVFSAAVVAAAQIFILWLHNRWALGQS